MRVFSLLGTTALIVLALSAVGDEPSQTGSDRLTFVCSLSKGDAVLYPVKSGTTPTDSNQMVITCDSLRFDSKGHMFVTNASIETKGCKFASSELLIDLEKPVVFTAGQIQNISVPKPQTSIQK